MRSLFKTMSMAVLLASVTIVSTNALAYDETDRAEIETKIAYSFDQYNQGNATALIESMPPSLLNYMADILGITVEEVKLLSIEMANSIMLEKPDSDKMSYTSNLEEAKVYESSTGREYVVLPLKTIISNDSSKVIVQASFIAIEEEGVWYIASLGGQQQADMIKEVYPDIVDLEFKESTREVIPLD